MVKCPFCQFDNEDGALFCEQCKSDLGAVEPVAMASPVGAAAAVPMAGAVETVPLGAEAAPAMAMPVGGDVPMAATLEAAPVEAAPAAPAAEAAPEAPPAAPAAAPAAPPAAGGALPAGAQPRLVVMRGQKLNVEYPIYEGHNFIGRADEKPVDIDLEDQEPPDRIWSSRQHALITYENSTLVLEDLNSSNGTFVNRTRVYPGQKRPLAVNDVVQIGTVQLKLKA
jgi:hypothetical protein